MCLYYRISAIGLLLQVISLRLPEQFSKVLTSADD